MAEHVGECAKNPEPAEVGSVKDDVGAVTVAAKSCSEESETVQLTCELERIEPVTGGNSSVLEESHEKPLSKNQRKKLLRHQKYLELKKQRKIIKKEKKREKRERRELDGEPFVGEPPKKIKTMDCGDALPLKVVIDLGFDHLMTERDVLKLMKQVQRCYALNRRADHPFQFYLTSFHGKSKNRLDEIGGHYHKWDVHIKSEPLTQVFQKEDIVYLSSESPNVLTEIDMSKVYVIGGLVDHNHYRGHCYYQAVEQGMNHAQLPLEEFVKINSRKVLTVNHVFEILMHYCESKDWKDAFFKVVPSRKVNQKVWRRRKAATQTEEDKNIANSDNDESSENEAEKEEASVEPQTNTENV